MKEKLEEVQKKTHPVFGLLTILCASAVFLAFLIGITALIRFIMA